MKFSGNVSAQLSVGDHFKDIAHTLCNKELLRTACILSLRVVYVHAVDTVSLEQAVINKILLGETFQKT